MTLDIARPEALDFLRPRPDIGAELTGTYDEMNDTTQATASEPNAPSTAPEDGFAVIEKLNAENAELKDRVLRGLADVENMRRRSEREAGEARTYAVTAFARDLLTVADNLARALENLPAEARAEAEGATKTLIEGVDLTARELQAVLSRHGVKKVEPLGEKFDPNFHQAMFEVPEEALPAGTVTQVVQSGWKIGERVLRPAMVGVSKGGPKAAPKAD
jgi:molecular chaperone GrpE